MMFGLPGSTTMEVKSKLFSPVFRAVKQPSAGSRLKNTRSSGKVRRSSRAGDIHIAAAIYGDGSSTGVGRHTFRPATPQIRRENQRRTAWVQDRHKGIFRAFQSALEGTGRRREVFRCSLSGDVRIANGAGRTGAQGANRD